MTDLSGKHAWLVAVIATSIVLSLARTAWAEPTTPTSDTTDDVIVFDHHHEPLLNATTVTIQGTRLANGRCKLSFPKLYLAPGEQAVALSQLSVNRTDCTSIVEIGEPPEGWVELDAGNDYSTASGPALPVSTRDSRGSSTEEITNHSLGTLGGYDGADYAGYCMQWWDDPIHLDVNRVTSNIAWAISGGCIEWYGGWCDYWWRSGTGWARDSWGCWSGQGSPCNSVNVWADAIYSNYIFCWPAPETFVHYVGVTVQGTAWGGLYGWTNDTWVDNDCITLHPHQIVQRTK